MKILIFHTYNAGFLSNFFFEISQKLVDEGHSVYNCSFKSRDISFNNNGVEIVIKKRRGYFGNYKNVYKIIKLTKPDIIISNFLYTNPALLFGKLLRVPKKITWFHSLITQTGASKLNVEIKSQFLKYADIIVANSLYTKEELASEYEIEPSKIKTLPFWTNIINDPEVKKFEILDRGNTNFRIGCPGRFSPDKNQKLIIEALAQLNPSEKEKVQLYFVGSGVSRFALKRIVKENQLDSNVHLLDFIDPKSMKSFYRSMDLIVLPSLSEAFGLVFIEAISLGVPVLVSNQFGALTFLDRNSEDFEKFTFNPSSAKELSQKINSFILNPPLSSGFFESMYKRNYNECLIYEEFKKIIFN